MAALGLFQDWPLVDEGDLGDRASRIADRRSDLLT
jgi:hypothetical protein